MAEVLILFAHPAYQRSRVNRAMVHAIEGLEGVTFRDLYEQYPEFDIDVGREQRLLAENDIIILQHPFYWYSTPAILKEWQDLVLEHGWAYGSTGNALTGKKLLSVVSTGGKESSYRRDGYNRFTLRELLRPIEQTAFLCGMEYLPPYAVHGTFQMTPEEVGLRAEKYRELVLAMRDDLLNWEKVGKANQLNSALSLFCAENKESPHAE